MLLYKGIRGNPISRQFSESRRKTMELLRKQSDTFFYTTCLDFLKAISLSPKTQFDTGYNLFFPEFKELKLFLIECKTKPKDTSKQTNK